MFSTKASKVYSQLQGTNVTGSTGEPIADGWDPPRLVNARMDAPPRFLVP